MVKAKKLVDIRRKQHLVKRESCPTMFKEMMAEGGFKTREEVYADIHRIQAELQLESQSEVQQRIYHIDLDKTMN